MPKRLFDCFTFFDELDLLEVRFHELYASVDHFVIIEAPVTFQGKPKPLHFHDNRARYRAFHDKVIHIVFEDFPATENPWDRERYQRNAIRQMVDRADAEDIIIVSDADEIISRTAIAKLRELSGFIQLDMRVFQYYINLCSDKSGWTKPFAFSRRIASQVPDFSWVRTHQTLALEQFGAEGHRITEAGWHFTHLGGPARVRNLLNAFSNTEGWHADMRQEGAIEAHIDAGYVVGNYWHLVEYCPLDETFPRFVAENQASLLARGYIRDPYEALARLQVLARAKSQEVAELQRILEAVKADRQLLIDNLNESILRLGPVSLYAEA